MDTMRAALVMFLLAGFAFHESGEAMAFEICQPKMIQPDYPSIQMFQNSAGILEFSIPIYMEGCSEVCMGYIPYVLWWQKGPRRFPSQHNARFGVGPQGPNRVFLSDNVPECSNLFDPYPCMLLAIDVRQTHCSSR